MTTDLPFASAASTLARAGPSAPPINSTKRSIFGEAARAIGSLKNSHPLRSASRSLSGSRTEIAVTMILRPGTRSKRLVLPGKQSRNRCADRADSGDADAQCIRHGYLRVDQGTGRDWRGVADLCPILPDGSKFPRQRRLAAAARDARSQGITSCNSGFARLRRLFSVN